MEVYKMKTTFLVKKTLAITLFFVMAVVFVTLFSVSAENPLTPEEEGLITHSPRPSGSLSAVTAGESDRYYVVFKSKPVQADESMVASRGAAIRHKFDRVSAYSVTVPNDSVLNSLKSDSNVDYVEPVSRVYALEEIIPWGIAAVKAPLVWDTVTGAGVKVCVVDSGIDYNHPDLDDLYAGGWDYVNNDNDPWDDFGHGTHCAGTVAAESNGIGVIGVAYDVTLYACKVLDDEGSGWSDDVMAGVQWALDNGADIASLSLGGPSSGPTEEAFYQSVYDAGLLTVCAAGNDGILGLDYPARYTSTIGVGSVDMDLNRSTFSQYGPNLELMAPGEIVYSTVPLGTGYETSVTQGGTGYQAIAMTYSGLTDDDGITATLHYCNYGINPSDFPPGVNGNIALIQRGSISFAQKATNAMNAGAVAVIIYNNAPNIFLGTLGNPGAWVPVLSMSNADGEALRAMGTPTITLINIAGDYDYSGGTSMSTPHVAGTAALVMQANSSLTNVQVREIMNNTAVDLGDPGWDQYYGYGLVDAEAAVNAATSEFMFISSIKMELRRVEPRYVQAIASVKVIDTSDQPVGGATVYGFWSGCVSGRVQGITGNNGIAELKSPLFDPASYLSAERPCFIINITNILHDTLQYAPEMNKVPPIARICY
jgi:subtilisin family serine protease